MKFKVTATIPIELEIDCQSKKEALDTATTILQEQRYDDDYASIVADCIESALVSGSITMTAVDDHEALVNELRTKRKISIQDMDAFLGYEIDKNDDMMFDDDYINANLWMVHATAIGLGSMSDRFRLLWKQSMRRKIRLFSVCRSATVPSNRCSICTTTLVWIWNPIISAVPSGTTRIE